MRVNPFQVERIKDQGEKESLVLLIHKVSLLCLFIAIELSVD